MKGYPYHANTLLGTKNEATILAKVIGIREKQITHKLTGQSRFIFLSVRKLMGNDVVSTPILGQVLTAQKWYLHSLIRGYQCHKFLSSGNKHYSSHRL